MKIVVAIDKFKGCATQAQLSQTITRELKRLLPRAQVVAVPVADGGDGTLQVVKKLIGSRNYRLHTTTVMGPHFALPPHDAQYIITRDRTAYIELATASGLALVPPELRNPLYTTTIGTGMMIADAVENGADHIVLGLGGSATCDAGMGIMFALGATFFTKNYEQLPPCGESLQLITRADLRPYNYDITRAKYTLLTDVNAPLLGPEGAARVFAPQKGATPEQVEMLEQGMENWARKLPKKIVNAPGAGAAGGVAATMMAAFDAAVVPGAREILRLARFHEIVADAHLVITGEGCLDRQTAMGKAPGEVLRAASEHNVPVIALCGTVRDEETVAGMGFSEVHTVTPPGTPPPQALDTRATLTRLRQVIKAISHEF